MYICWSIYILSFCPFFFLSFWSITSLQWTACHWASSIYEFEYLTEDSSDDESVRSSGEKTLGQELQGRIN